MFNEKLRQTALSDKIAFSEAEEVFCKSYWKFMESVTSFEFHDARLWKFVASLSKRCVEDRDVDSACHNTFCYWEKEDMTDAFRAMATIADIKSALYEPLFGVITGRGDDGYGDLLDAFFLAGPDIVNEVLAGTYTVGDEDELKHKILSQCGSKIFDIIWNGENYFGMNFDKAGKIWLNYTSLPEEKIEPLKESKEGKFWHETF